MLNGSAKHVGHVGVEADAHAQAEDHHIDVHFEHFLAFGNAAIELWQF